MNPIIDSIVATPAVVRPGGTFVLTIAAHDPDEKTLTITGTATDAAGNASSATVLVRVSDPITFGAVGAGVTIVPRAGAPGVFDCLAT